MDLARHRLETTLQEKTTRETSQAVERRPGQILERHDTAENSTRQGNLETTCWGLMMKWWIIQIVYIQWCTCFKKKQYLEVIIVPNLYVSRLAILFNCIYPELITINENITIVSWEGSQMSRNTSRVELGAPQQFNLGSLKLVRGEMSWCFTLLIERRNDICAIVLWQRRIHDDNPIGISLKQCICSDTSTTMAWCSTMI